MADFPRMLFHIAQKPAQLITKFSQCFILSRVQRPGIFAFDIYIVLRYCKMVRAFEEPAFSPDLITGRKGLFIASLILAQKRDFVSELGKSGGPAQRPASFVLPLFKYIALRYTGHIRDFPDSPFAGLHSPLAKGFFMPLIYADERRSQNQKS